jgi:hypothetical protein
VEVAAPDEGHRGLGLIGPEGNAARQDDTVEGDALAGEAPAR